MGKEGRRGAGKRERRKNRSREAEKWGLARKRRSGEAEKWGSREAGKKRRGEAGKKGSPKVGKRTSGEVQRESNKWTSEVQLGIKESIE